MRTGRIWINTYNQIPAGAPFGGYKKSGIGREVYKDAIKTINKLKISLLIQVTNQMVCININKKLKEGESPLFMCLTLSFYHHES